MAEEKNVGKIDSALRILLGLACVGVFVYQFAVDGILPIYALVPIGILIPLFLKTGITRVCPIMHSMNVSTAGPAPQG